MWGCPDRAGSGKNTFHPIVLLPDEYWVLNLQKPQTTWNQQYEYTVGRYDEDRRGMYTQDLFGGERTIHVGLDIGGPVQTPILRLRMEGFTVLQTTMRMDPTVQPSLQNTQSRLMVNIKPSGFFMVTCLGNR